MDAFFPGRITDPDISSVLTENNSNPAFESFYKNSIRKMLLLGKRNAIWPRAITIWPAYPTF